MSLIIAIAGGSCSGKTTLARHLQTRLGDSSCMLIRQDDYYHDIRIRAKEGEIPNFDIPEALDFEQLGKDLRNLKAGKAVALPNYDFTTHQRRQASKATAPRPYTIVEGILLLNSNVVRQIADVRVYMKCNRDIRFARRLSRDVANRGRTEEFVRHQFQNDVEPAHKTFVEPSAAFADIVIEQSQYVNDLEGTIEHIVQCIPNVMSPSVKLSATL